MGAFLVYKLALLALLFWQPFLADVEVGERAGRFFPMDRGPAGRNWSGLADLVAGKDSTQCGPFLAFAVAIAMPWGETILTWI